MHFEDKPPPTPVPAGAGPWWRELTRYHWFVLTVAALGWLFDCLDQQLFILARNPAMRDLLQQIPGETREDFIKRADYYGTWSTSIFLIGWATGGIIFGILGDRIGRARTMLLTILVYSLCTGLSALSTGIADFCLYRFLTGLGVGGEFAVGVALVAEVMPDRARPFALGLLQALSALGNVSAALINLGLGHLESVGFFKDFTVAGQPVSAWRAMFVIGTLPALLALLIRRRLKEPERWKAVAGAPAEKDQLGSLSELFGDPRWRRHALVGLVLALAGQIGLWGIGFYFPELTRSVFRQAFQAQGLTGDALEGKLKVWASVTSLLMNGGAFFGIYAFSRLTHYTGRRGAFALAFLLALGSTALVFGLLKTPVDVYWMIPLMGFCQLSLFGGYAIYFPELFPTRLRSTGTSFCYNVGRLAAAAGPLWFGLLINSVFVGYEAPLPYRYAGLTMCSIFLLGLFVLPFAPETKDKPLPE
jgi:MFS family permease